MLRPRDARDPAQIRAAFSAMIADRPDALLVVTDPVILRHQAEVVELAAAHKLPVMYGNRRPLDEGGLLCYAADIREVFRGGAYFVDKILKGAKPADLPVQQLTRSEFLINLRTAEALGLTIPQSILHQATEIVQ